MTQKAKSPVALWLSLVGGVYETCRWLHGNWKKLTAGYAMGLHHFWEACREDIRELDGDDDGQPPCSA